MATKDVTPTWFMAAAATRAALQASGAASVTLKVCGGSAAGAAVRGLGLAAPAMQSILLSPVLVRSNQDGTREVLVDASTLTESTQSERETLRSVLLLSRVEVDGVDKKIVRVGTETLGGAAYLYRIGLEA